MDCPPGATRSSPDIVTLEPMKIWNGNTAKENIPPPAIAETPNQIGILIDKQCQATPKKRLPNEDPVTPNTNFKLLTSLAATLDYANCSTPKSKGEDIKTTEDVIFDNQTCEDSGATNIFNPQSRKEKSLAIICTRFLDIFPLCPASSEGSIVVSLDEVSAKLGIERRRLYDIVNVFESIEMLKKLAKNRYLWYGKTNLINALQKIKSAALNENVLEKLQYVLESEENVYKQSCILEDVKDFNKKYEFHKSSSITPEILRYQSPLPELRKEKSLAIMSQKFLMLFLVSPTKIISLGVAAKVLNGFQNNERGAQIKTQIRRLYDIANVLSSIGLIKKEVTIGQNGRKPAFKYIGPELGDKAVTPSKESQKQSQRAHFQKLKPKSLVRHSSFQEICAVAEMERKKIFLDELPNSAPPFQKSFQNVDLTPEKTSFSDLKLKLEPKEVSPPSHNNYSCNLKDLQTLPLLQNNQIRSVSAGNKKSQPQMRSISLPRQSSLKLINVPRQILAANGPYYILNPSTKEVVQSPTPMGTVLLISPISVKKSMKEVKSETLPEKKATTSQTLQLSAEQRDTILKSLNLSLSDGQIAAIQLEGSSQSANLEIKPRCNLLKIIEKHEQVATSVNDKKSPITFSIRQTSTNDTESQSSIPCGSRNPSPSNSSRFDSPVNLPSGLVTPVYSASSDNSQLSNCENVSAKIESPAKATELHFKQGHFVRNSPSDSKKETRICFKSGTISLLKPLNKGGKRKSEELMENCKNNLPLKDVHNVYSTSDSCSSDGINTEVSEILNGRVKESKSNHVEPFLIDEKTILSPLKKHKGVVISKHLTPTSFTTPPYTVHDACFEFNNLPFAMSK